MSKEVDERVVSMQFDNAQFEANIKSTIKSLQDLDKNLQLKNASTGLDTVATSIKKVDMSPLSRALDTISVKFSTLQVMGTTAIANITNQIVNSAKQITNSLTKAPIKDGFNEYETQMNAIQTILANTQSKGTTLDDVNNALDTLNTYADKTIYNFSQMTRNIGTFTAAGISLEDSTKAIQGIANLAAVSGSNANQASVAMYQLSQALAAGTVKLQDWNSVVNAGMGGQVFQEALKKTARVHGVAVDEIIKKEGSFRESLQEGWITSEILTETLSKMTKTGAAEYLSNLTGITKGQIEATQNLVAENKDGIASYDELAEQMAKTGKVSKDDALEILKMADTAEDAATKVKTFTQLMDTLKEAVGSGWAKTWQLLIGNFSEAKDLFTGISDTIGGFINKVSDARNNLLEKALGSKQSFFDNILGKIDEAGFSKMSNAAETISNVTKELSYYQDMVTKIWRGDYGNGQKRIELLTGEGHNYNVLQSLVDKGYEYKITMDDVTEAETKFGKSLSSVSEASSDAVTVFQELSDEQLKGIGLTDDEISAYRDLEEQSKKTGVAMKDIVANMDSISGRSLLLGGLKNICNSLATIFKALGKAWREVFPAYTADQLYNLIASFHKFTTTLKINDKTAENIKDTFKGLFSILKLTTDIIGGGFKFAFKLANSLLSNMGLNIWDVTGAIGKILTKIADWVDNVFDLDWIIEKVAPAISKFGGKVKEFFEDAKVGDALVETFLTLTGWIKKATNAVIDWFVAVQPFKKVGNLFKSAAVGVKEWINGLKEADNIPLYIIKGIIKGVQNGTSGVFKAFWNLGEIILNAVKKVLGIASPAKAFIEIIKWCFKGILEGIKEYGPKAIESIIDFFKQIPPLVMDILNALPPSIKEVVMRIPEAVKLALEKIFDIVKKLDFGNVFAAVLTVGIYKTVNKVVNVMDMLSKSILNVSLLFSGLGSMFNNFGNALVSFTKGWETFTKGLKVKMIAEGFRDIIISIGALMAAIYLISKVQDKRSLWEAVGVLTAVSAVIIAIIKILAKTNLGPDATKKIMAFAAVLGTLVLAIYAITNMITKLSKAAITLGSVNTKVLEKGIISVALLSGIVVGLIAAVEGFTKRKKSNVKGVASVIMSVGVCMALMAQVAKSIGKMKFTELAKGVIVISLFASIIDQLVLCVGASTKNGRTNVKGIASTIMSVGVCMALMAQVAKTLGKMSISELFKGTLAISAFALIITGLIAATKLAGKDKNTVGVNILAISVAIGLLVFIGNQLSKMDTKSFEKGIAMIAAYGSIITGLIAATKLAGKDAKYVGLNIFLISGAIALLAGVSVLLGMVDIKQLEKGVTAVAILSGVMDGLMLCCSTVDKNCMKTLILITAIIVVLAGITVGLSFIEEDKLRTASAALSVLMGAFALLVKCCKSIDEIRNLKQVTKTLAILGIVVAALGAEVWALSKMPSSDGLIEKAGALAILMTAMSWCLVPIAACQKNMPGAGGWSKVAQLAVDMAALLVSLEIMILELKQMEGLDNAKENANILTQLMVALSLCLIPLSIAGDLMALSGGMGVLSVAGSLLSLVGSLELIILELIQMEDLNNAETNVNLLTQVMQAMTETLTEISKVSGLAILGDVAIQGLEVVLTEFIALSEVLGTLCEIPGFKKFLDTGADLLIAVAGKVGEAVGSFIDGTIDAMTQSLPDVGARLTNFWNKSKDFFDGVTGLNKVSVLGGIGVITGAILALCVADLINGITTLLSMGNGGFLSLGTELSSFWSNCSGFLSNVSEMNESATQSVKNLADALLAITASNLINQISSFFGGGVDFGQFGEQLGTFGEGIVSFAQSVQDPSVSEDTLGKGADAAKKLGEMASYLPSTGGLLQGLVGEKDMREFGNQLSNFGGGLVMFAQAVTGIKGYEEDVDTATEMGTGLAKLNKSIPGAFGLVQGLFGEKSLSNFGNDIRNFGGGLSGFATSVDGISNYTEDANAAVEIGTKLAELTDSLDKTGSKFKTFWAGDKDLGAFGENIEDFGSGLKSYCEAVSGINVGSVNSATAAAKVLAEIANMDTDILTFYSDDYTDYEKFRTGLYKFGKGIQEYVNTLKGYSKTTITNAAEAGTQICNMINNISTKQNLLDIFGGSTELSDLSTQLKDFGQGIVDFTKSVNEIKSGDVEKAKQAGDLILSLCNSVPKSGGIFDYLKGTSDYSGITEGLKSLGLGIKEFTLNVSSVKAENVTEAATAGSSILNMYSLLPTLKKWENKISWATVSDGLADFGASVKDFQDNSNGLDATKIQNGVDACEIAYDLYKALVTTNTSVTRSIASLMGKNDNGTSDFDCLSDFAASVKNFSDNSNGIVSSYVAAGVSSGESIINLLKYAGEKNVTLGKIFANSSDMESFKTDLEGLGEAIKSYATSIDGINSTLIEDATQAATSIFTSIKTMTISDTISSISSQLPDFGEALSDFADTVNSLDTDLLKENSLAITVAASNFNAAGDLAMSKFIDAFTNSKQKAVDVILDMLDSMNDTIVNFYKTMELLGQNIITYFKVGMQDKTAEVTTNFSTFLDGMQKCISDRYESYKTSGKNLVQGFADGISTNVYLATAAADSLGKETLKALNAALEEQSPSKATYKSGTFFSKGFTNALYDNMSSVKKSATRMAITAKDGLSMAIDKLNELNSYDNNMTITPVLDLTDVNDGINQINGMFGHISSSVSPNLEFSRIRSAFNTKSQNGTTNDVVEAINDLKGSVGSTNNNYTINGITYDSGSEVADAIETLVRATKIGRRK